MALVPNWIVQKKLLYPFRKQVMHCEYVLAFGLFVNSCIFSSSGKDDKLTFFSQVGGSILSAKLALERGWSINVGGGFHHCSAEEGGGFCAYADISLCIQFAFVRLNISR